MKKKTILFTTALLLSTSSLFSWTDHYLGAYFALEPMPEMTKGKTKVESFEKFLNAEKSKLAPLLEEIDAELIKEFSNYPKTPDELKFDPTKKEIRNSFLTAIRVNPKIPLKLFIQELPGSSIGGKKRLKPSEISIFENDEYMDKYMFTELKEGQTIAPIHVVSSGSDEPDYGHDIALFEDNASEFGAKYKFGQQPFGNPKYQYASQAPFHMGFYFESSILYSAAPYFKNTYPEIRALQYYKLAKFAFQTGHDYWGYRFLGWSLHYIGDLTQPFHSTLLPGIGTTRALWVNIKASIGLDGAKKEIIERLSDRHTAIEHYQFEFLSDLIRKKDFDHAMIQAYKKTENDATYPEFFNKYAREVVASESNKKAEKLDELIEASPYIFSFKENKIDFPTMTPDEESKAVNEYLIQLLNSFGSHTRNVVKKAIEK